MENIEINVSSNEAQVINSIVSEKHNTIVMDIEHCTEYLEMGSVCDYEGVLNQRSRLIEEKIALESLLFEFQNNGIY